MCSSIKAFLSACVLLPPALGSSITLNHPWAPAQTQLVRGMAEDGEAALAEEYCQQLGLPPDTVAPPDPGAHTSKQRCCAAGSIALTVLHATSCHRFGHHCLFTAPCVTGHQPKLIVTSLRDTHGRTMHYSVWSWLRADGPLPAASVYNWPPAACTAASAVL
jgi:hypothetical protein